MISRLRSVNREQRKLLLSLGTNVMTRVPGAIGVLFFLPVLRFGLGTGDYAALLASIALGTASTFLFGSFSLIGRRLIGEAHSIDDKQAEADGFVSMVAANLCALALAVILVTAYQFYQQASAAVLVASLIPIAMAFVNTLDNVRASYNEHYVTATLQFFLQIILYTIGFTVLAVRHSLLMAAFVIQGHLILASIIAGTLLIRHRPYLLRGRATGLWQVIVQGTRLALADGVLMSTLSLAIVWLYATAPASTSAWFSTLVRIFQTFLVPVVLLLMPLSSYVRLLWSGTPPHRQRFIVQLTFTLGVGYGIAIAIALSVAAKFYIGRALHLPMPGSFWHVAPIFLLFAGIIAYKSYSSIAYLILDVSHLATATSIGVGGAVVISALASLVLGPLDTICLYGLIAGTALFAILRWSASRFTRRPPQEAELVPA